MRWGKAGDYSGWYSVGTRSPERLLHPERTFWERVLGLATSIGNGRLDACHCIGEQQLTFGGPGFTIGAPFDSGVLLLWECQVECPEWWVHCMLSVLRETSVYPWFPGVTTTDYRTERGEPATPFLYRLDGAHPSMLTPSQLDGALRGGSDSKRWVGGKAKAMAFSWVAGLSKLLSSESTVPAQLRVCERWAPQQLSEKARVMLCWPSNGASDLWMWSEDQQRLWRIAMALALVHGPAASDPMEKCVQAQPEDARASLESLGAFAASERGVMGHDLSSLIEAST